MKISLKLTVAMASCLLMVDAAGAALSKPDRKSIKQRMKSTGTLYMKLDMPCATGRHPYGTYVRPLVEVSPEGTNSEAENGVSASWWHADSTYWGVSVNDPVLFDEMEIEADEGTMEIELVTPDEDVSTVVKFIEIYTLDDFEAAFDRTFSDRPLQDTHDDWPEEIKKAIGDRELMNGMTKRQVYYITGAPESFEKTEEDGKKVETWSLRQDKGVQLGFWMSRVGETTGLPESLRFEDGKLVDARGSASGFSLDDE